MSREFFWYKNSTLLKRMVMLGAGATLQDARNLCDNRRLYHRLSWEDQDRVVDTLYNWYLKAIAPKWWKTVA